MLDANFSSPNKRKEASGNGKGRMKVSLSIYHVDFTGKIPFHLIIWVPFHGYHKENAGNQQRKTFFFIMLFVLAFYIFFFKAHPELSDG